MRTIKQYNEKRKLINKLIKTWEPVLRNAGVLNAGLVYTPYIPVQLEPVMFDDQLVGISSRYVSVQVNPNNYGVINVPDVNE
jgi:hypothetical protein